MIRIYWSVTAKPMSENLDEVCDQNGDRVL